MTLPQYKKTIAAYLAGRSAHRERIAMKRQLIAKLEAKILSRVLSMLRWNTVVLGLPELASQLAKARAELKWLTRFTSGVPKPATRRRGGSPR